MSCINEKQIKFIYTEIFEFYYIYHPLARCKSRSLVNESLENYDVPKDVEGSKYTPYFLPFIN